MDASSLRGAVEVQRAGRVAMVTLARPERRNAICDAMLADLVEALAELDEDHSVGCVVITGGERQFATGADLRELADRSVEQMALGRRERLWATLRATRQPLIAAVCGLCLGAGLELALSCDLVLASQTAIFGAPELAVGLIPGGGATQLLVRAVGRALAMDMVLSGRRLDAAEALAAGLASRVAPAQSWRQEAAQLAGSIAERPTLASRLAKQAMRIADETPLTAGIAFERAAFNVAFGAGDRVEGIQAFLERRPARWAGRPDLRREGA